MATKQRQLKVVVTGDADELRKAIQTANKELNSMNSRADSVAAGLDKWGKRAVAASGVAAAGLFAAANAASDLAETQSKSNTVFKESSDAVNAWAKDSAKSFGQSKREALDAASGFGNLFVQLGVGTGQAAELSMQMTELASDFASFHNADITQVIDAQTAAFRGEYDALQQFVPTINAAAVEQRALAMTGKETTDQLTAQEKALAVQKLMLEGAGDAMGDFDRTSGSAANQQRILKAELENLKAGIGAGVLPVVQELVAGLSNLTGAFTSLSPETQSAIGKFATFATGGLALAGTLSFVAGKVIEARSRFQALFTTLNVDGTRSLNNFAKGAIYAAGALAAMYAVMQNDPSNPVGAKQLEIATKILDQYSRGILKAADAVEVYKLASKFGEGDELFTALVKMSRPAAEEWMRLLDESGIDTAEFEQILADIPATAAEVTTSIEQGIVPAQRSMTKAYHTSNEAIAENTEKLKAAEEALKELVDATLGAFNAQLGYEQQTWSTREAIDALGWAAIAAKVAVDDKSTIINEATLAEQQYSESLNAASSEALEQAAAAAQLAEQQAAASGATFTAADSARIQREELEKLAGGLAPDSPLRARLEEYIARLDNVPSKVKTILEIEEQFKYSDRSAGGGILGGGNTGGRRHSGGMIWQDGLYGLRAGETVTTPGRSMTSGGQTIIVEIGGQVLVDALVAYDERNAGVPIRIKATGR